MHLSEPVLRHASGSSDVEVGKSGEEIKDCMVSMRRCSATSSQACDEDAPAVVTPKRKSLDESQLSVGKQPKAKVAKAETSTSRCAQEKPSDNSTIKKVNM